MSQQPAFRLAADSPYAPAPTGGATVSIAELEECLRQASASTTALEDAANSLAYQAKRLREQAEAAHKHEMRLADQLERARELQSLRSQVKP
jgi:hypothetical protein